MINLKSIIYYLSESEKIFNDRIFTNRPNTFSRSSLIIEKCTMMLHNFLNMIMEDELKMIGKLTDLHSSEVISEVESVFHNVMQEAIMIYEKSKGNLDDEVLLNELASHIISLRLNYLALKSIHPDLF